MAGPAGIAGKDGAAVGGAKVQGIDGVNGHAQHGKGGGVGRFGVIERGCNGLAGRGVGAIGNARGIRHTRPSGLHGVPGKDIDGDVDAQLQVGLGIPDVQGGAGVGVEFGDFGGAQIGMCIEQGGGCIGGAQHNGAGLGLAIGGDGGEGGVARGGVTIIDATVKPQPDLRVECGEVLCPRMGIGGHAGMSLGGDVGVGLHQRAGCRQPAEAILCDVLITPKGSFFAWCAQRFLGVVFRQVRSSLPRDRSSLGALITPKWSFFARCADCFLAGVLGCWDQRRTTAWE